MKQTVGERVGGKRKQMETVPQDAVMLLSYVNLKLRDYYDSPDSMCEDLNVSRAELEEKLASIDYHYDKEINQFV